MARPAWGAPGAGLRRWTFGATRDAGRGRLGGAAFARLREGIGVRKIVEDLIRIEGVIGSLLVDKDGLVVSSTLLEDEDAEMLGAMSAAMFGAIVKAGERIGVGQLRNTIIEASEGSIQLVEAENLILVVITEKGVNLGMIRMEMRKAATRIRAEIPL